MSVDAATVVEVLVASGVFTSAASGLQWFFTRGRAKVDGAKVVQGMALEMLKPLHDELDGARAEVKSLRQDVHSAQAECAKVRRHFEILLGWALTLRDILEENQVNYPPVPPAVKERVE